MKKTVKTVEVKTNVTEERLQDLLCNAFEGGSNYWYFIESFNYPKGETRESLEIKFAHIELPFKGGSLTIICDGDMPTATLDRKAIKKGIQVMAKDYPRHYADFLIEDCDAITGDVFLQCCLYGEVVFS